MTTFREKRRTRRIASDEAHAWARSLQLGNPNAKSVLRALALYVDGEACCFVGIDQLAEDSDLSADTVRRRLVWLEEIGAIARTPQWIDASGRRNGDGRGRRTSDLIRLLITADADEIEARAAGRKTEDISTAISPSSLQGLNSDDETLSPRLAPRQPLQSCEGLISEPEPESPPLPPSGGEDVASLVESEPEDFAPAWQSWRGHEVMRRDLALAEFCKLKPDKQRLCRAAIPYFFALQDKLKRDRVPNFHLWVRSGGFEEFPDAKLGEARPPPPSKRFVHGDELAGAQVAYLVAMRRHLPTVRHPELGNGFWFIGAPQPDQIALARFAGEDPVSWLVVDEGTPQFAAWRDRLQLWLNREIEPERIYTEAFDPAVHGLPALDRNFRLRRSKLVFRVPAPWPPRRDGTWPADNGENAG